MMAVPVIRHVLLLCFVFVVSAPWKAAAQGEQMRETWQRVPELFAAMQVAPGAAVADIGAGGGFLTVRLAAAVGAGGRVYAIDIDPKVLDELRARVATERLANVR